MTKEEERKKEPPETEKKRKKGERKDEDDEAMKPTSYFWEKISTEWNKCGGVYTMTSFSIRMRQRKKGKYVTKVTYK